MAQPYPIVGIEDTGVQPRLELRDLKETNPIGFSLFIRALQKVQDMRNTQDSQSPDSFNNPNSWWQMGAIHGLPYIPWSGDPDGPQNPDPNSAWEGYCYHGSALFPTWHRVLVLLVEQAVVNEAITIASQLEEENADAKAENWLQAAKKLRFPFWDWTKLSTATEGIPQIFQDPRISIVNPGGASIEVQNPLNHYHYAAKPGVAKGVEYMGNWERTYRWVNDSQNPTQERYDHALKAFSEGAILRLYGKNFQLRPVDWLREKVAGLFTYDLTLGDPSYGPNMWGYFSNTGANSAGVYPPMTPMPPSVEESHNMVHLDTGGNGSMSVNEYAGFDPIFFLHHCNIDRLYAFWEYVYPEYWIENGWKSETGDIIRFRVLDGNFWQDKNASVGRATPLLPFRTKDSDYWTSDNTRSLWDTTIVTKKYYTYPAIKDPNTDTEVKVDVPYNVNDLSLRQRYRSILYKEWGPNLNIILEMFQDLASSEELSLSWQPLRLLLQVDNDVWRLRQYFITGELPEFAFPGSYRLELYILQRDTPEEAVHVVNSISVLGRANPDNCPACRNRRAAGSQIRGHMHLDPVVILYLLSRLDPIQRAGITGLDQLNVLIQESFGVRLVKPDGTKLAAADPYISAKHAPLEETKAPQLTLHSHVISLNPRNTVVPIEFQDAVTHGPFRKELTWIVF